MDTSTDAPEGSSTILGRPTVEMNIPAGGGIGSSPPLSILKEAI